MTYIEQLTVKEFLKQKRSNVQSEINVFKYKDNYLMSECFSELLLLKSMICYFYGPQDQMYVDVNSMIQENLDNKSQHEF